MTDTANPITPEKQALLDAAMRFSDRSCFTGKRYCDLQAALKVAVDAYRASIQPQECRPPAGAKDGDLFWLVRGDERIIRQWSPRLDMWCHTDGCHSKSARLAASEGWTVHSACTFPGERVAATDEAIAEWVGHYPRLGLTAEAVRAALRLFAPTLRPVSDEKIDAMVSLHFNMVFSRETQLALRKLVRAVLSYAQGEGE